MKEVQENVDNGHLMFYTHKTWTNSNLTFYNCWQECEVIGIHTHVNWGNQAYNAACRGNWWISSSVHISFTRLDGEAGDYHGQMNATNFEKWGAKKITPNFPPQPVIDNSPYHCLHVDRRLSTCTVKWGMIWLCRKGIVSDETMSKNDLPVNSSTEAQRDINKIDCILANHGHVVQLPPYV